MHFKARSERKKCKTVNHWFHKFKNRFQAKETAKNETEHLNNSAITDI